jgi:geranylgeranyl pyrophosphate synthase
MKDFSYINEKLKLHFSSYEVKHPFYQVLEYALFPAGKLFRSQLVYALSSDLSSHTANHEFLASAIEMHHTYTLIHDDLPAMDDDDYRRGREATHKKFGEANAILAGDALLGMSYGVLSNIKSNKLNDLLRLFHTKTGTAGLVLGQVLDLENTEKSLDDVLLIHKLKTARLIQLALTGSNMLCENSLEENDLEEFGEALGVTFQLLDDLCELADKISNHEATINPFILFEEEIVCKNLIGNMKVIHQYLMSNKLNNIQEVIETYYSKVNSTVDSNRAKIDKYIDSELLDDVLKFTSF